MNTRTILNWYTNAVIWQGEAVTVREAIHAALATGADLRGADLRGADLRDANLAYANLRDADLRGFRDDLWAVLSSAPREAAALLTALETGRVDGSTYQGACACLVGTLAHARGCEYDAMAGLQPDASRLAEVWFAQIKPGDTPDTSPAAKQAADWTRDWIDQMRAAFGEAHQ